ncbi:hypothetical protein BV20DRAFT_979399 [Pilatotrama ljubarskyi]|nr:hypothetical protein BV20DRAFT_979399 [Pilatotrama ljubarskyi]
MVANLEDSASTGVAGDAALMSPSKTSGNTLTSPLHGRVVLGLGWVYPPPQAKPDGVTFRYWYASEFKERPKKGGGKQGPHDDSINVAQTFIEDERGQPVSGTVAKDIREMLCSLLHSLVWSGQAPESQDLLPHEARVYLHVSLARRFPFLLLCDGGAWKINALIKQMYHGFSANHIKLTPAAAARLKSEPRDVYADLLAGKNMTTLPLVDLQKRSRQGSLHTSLPQEKPGPSKVPRIASAAGFEVPAATTQSTCQPGPHGTPGADSGM